LAFIIYKYFNYMIRKPKSPDTGIHVGELIKNYLTVNKISRAALARELNVGDGTILSYQKSSGGNNSTLLLLCHALKHNFFADIAALLPKTYTTTAPIDHSSSLKIAELKQEITILKAEKAVLLQAFGK
jgi:transcriptional regulator with XRE-family HTH domain